MTDVELDARITALEENGGGDGVNGKKYVASNFFLIFRSWLLGKLASYRFPNRIRSLIRN